MEQAVLASHTNQPRERIKAQALACQEQELTFTMVLTAGTQIFRPADGVALSRSSIPRREYVAEVTAINGVILTVTIVWPAGAADENSMEDIVNGTWCLHKFPSFVGHRRIAAALKAILNTSSCGRTLFEAVVGSFYISELSSEEAQQGNDAVPDGTQYGEYLRDAKLIKLSINKLTNRQNKIANQQARGRPGVEPPIRTTPACGQSGTPGF